MKKSILGMVGALMCVVLLFISSCGMDVIRTITGGETADSNEVVEETKEPDFVEIPTQVSNQAVIQGLSADILNQMSLEEKIGQLFIVNLELLDDSNGSYYEHREFTEKMMETLNTYHVGGVTLFSRNIETRSQTKKLIQDLQANSQYPLFVSVDEEGGDVSRIASNSNMKTTKFPSMEIVGAMNDLDYALEVGTTIGEQIRQLGFNVDFAPVADVKTNDLNTEIGTRSFGNDAKLVSKMVKQLVNGLQSEGISATLKHFPGQGDISEDSHQGAVNLETDLNHLRSVEFVPFQEGIKAGVDFVMVSHISISKISGDTTPASMCSLVMEQMLRDELGFDGVIITDAMNMKSITNYYSSKKAAVSAIKSGADIVLMPENLEEAYQGILEAVNSGELSEEMINQKVQRILSVKIKRGLLDSSYLVEEDATQTQTPDVLSTTAPEEEGQSNPEATASAVSNEQE